MVNMCAPCGSSCSWSLIWPACKCYSSYSSYMISIRIIQRLISITFKKVLYDFFGSKNPIPPLFKCPTDPFHIPSRITHNCNNVYRRQVGDNVIFIQLVPGSIDTFDKRFMTAFCKSLSFSFQVFEKHVECWENIGNG